MKKSSKLGFLLSALLMTSLFAGASFVSGASASSIGTEKERSSSPSPNEQVTTTDPTAEKPLTNIIVDCDAPPFTAEVGPEGAGGSGWKPDVNIVPGSIYTARDEVNPSIATYVNASTGAVTLWAAMQSWSGYYSHWFLWVWASNDRGATWWQRGAAEFMSNRSMTNPSIAVSPYNGTVFVAVQYAAYGTDYTNDVMIHVISPVAYGSWSSYAIDNDADEDRSPQLVTEYSFGPYSWLYVVYENYTTTNDRDLKVGRSTDWGKTWSTQTLRGAGADATTYTQPTIAYAQGNVYIAYRHSSTYADNGHIDVSYSANYGGSYTHITDVSSVPDDASWPSITGSHIGLWHQPAAVIVAYEYNTTITNHDILYAWSTDYGATWSGGNGYFNQVAASASYEFMPRLSVDGMGTESQNVGGNFHLIYRIGAALYYTQRQYWDIPVMLGPTPWANYLGWSSPHGLITDSSAYCSYSYPVPAITTFTKTVGSATLWEPGVTWTDLRNPNYDVYYTTPGTDFSVTITPSSQTVVAGTTTYYSLTVNLLSGPTAPAYLSGTNWPWVILGSNYAVGEYTASPINPTATCTLALTASNLMPAGNYYFNATATVGGYRRIVAVPFTVITPPTLVVRGNDNQIYYRTCDTDAQIWTLYPGFGTTCDSPAATICGTNLHVVVRGMDGNTLWHGRKNLINGLFSGWTLLSGSTPSAPTLTGNTTHLCLVVRGQNGMIYYRFYAVAAGTWTGWTALPTGSTVDSPAATILENKLHVVVRGADGNTLWHSNLDLSSAAFSGWTLVGGATPSKPTLTASASRRSVYLVVRGLDNNVYRNTWSGSSWAGWVALPGGSTCDGVGAAVFDDKLNVVIRSLDGNSLLHGAVDLATGSFTSWTLLSGSTPSAPTLTS